MTRHAMIFAAGFGTRMRPLTDKMPKPLIPVAGKTLIDRTLDLVAAAHVSKVVVNTHYLADQMHQHLARQNVDLSHETPDILDTGGGLRAALPLLGPDPVFTVNPDVVWLGPNPLNLLDHAWDPDKMDALLMCTPLPRTHGRKGNGDFDLNPDGIISRPGQLVYGGAQILKTDRLTTFPETSFSLNAVWDQMAKGGRLAIAEYPGEWCDVGAPENIALVEQLLGRANV